MNLDRPRTRPDGFSKPDAPAEEGGIIPKTPQKEEDEAAEGHGRVPRCATLARAGPDAMLSSMADKGKSSGMKSAYELALERLEKQGIERPREESLSPEAREKVAEIRKKAEAKLAELEILHKDRLKGVYDPAKRQEDEEEYVRERRRIEEERDRKIEELRRR